MENLGTFEVVSGKIIASDPCYENPDNYGKCGYRKPYNKISRIIQVPNGTWCAWLKKSKCRSVAELSICHNSIVQEKGLAPTCYDFHINDEYQGLGVDSGQFGFFDLQHFRDDDNTKDFKLAKFIGIESQGEKWYAMCCEISCNSKLNGGVIPNGVLSSSGYGDGMYTVTTYEKDDKIVFINVVFIDEYESDEESY